MLRRESSRAGTHRTLELAVILLPALGSWQLGAGTAAAVRVGQSGASPRPVRWAAPLPPSVVETPTGELVHELPELKKLRPAASQELLASILQKVGANVAILFNSFPSVTSREEVIEQRLSGAGAVHDQIFQEFRYLALASPDKRNVGFEEYRTDSKGRLLQPQGLDSGYLITEGFVSIPFYFHPSYQPDSKFRYLGQEVMGKRATEVVAFAQRPSAREREQFAMGGKSVYVLAQGVAWIDPANNQIVRMRTDLRTPEPEIRLDSQTTRVKFAEVDFKGVSSPLWLPREVEVETRCYGTVFRNTHSYSQFKLFSVQTQERQGAPASRR
jgi:hypothetical protein